MNGQAQNEANVIVATGSAGTGSSEQEDKAARRRKLFGDCALIEIIHLHDCLRGAIKALEKDVNELNNLAEEGKGSQLEILERRVAGRFKVIWSVFRAHSSAEDEFIWPALQKKTQGRIKHSPKYRPGGSGNEHPGYAPVATVSGVGIPVAGGSQSGEEDNLIEQSEYHEDHQTEEIMFETIDTLLAKLRRVLLEHKDVKVENKKIDAIHQTAEALSQHTQSLSKHLYQHLEKEENQCMPLVVKHLSRSEIHDLVGNIMGKRSSELIAKVCEINNERGSFCC